MFPIGCVCVVGITLVTLYAKGTGYNYHEFTHEFIDVVYVLLCIMSLMIYVLLHSLISHESSGIDVFICHS